MKENVGKFNDILKWNEIFFILSKERWIYKPFFSLKMFISQCEITTLLLGKLG